MRHNPADSARGSSPETLDPALFQAGRKALTRAPGDRLFHGHAQSGGVNPLEPFDPSIKERPDNRAVADLLAAHNLDIPDLAQCSHQGIMLTGAHTLLASAHHRDTRAGIGPGYVTSFESHR
jgi:hypothetical protein